MILWALVLLANFAVTLHVLGEHGVYLARAYSPLIPWAPILLLPVLLLAVLRHRAMLGLAAVSPLIYSLVVCMPSFMKSTLPTVGDGQCLKVMTLNVWSENDRIDLVAEIVKSEAPDIVMLQEITPDQFRVLAKHLYLDEKQGLLFSAYLPKGYMAVLSRYAINGSTYVGSSRIKVQDVTLQIGAHKVKVYNVHFLRKFWKRRVVAINKFVEEKLKNDNGPVILAGDFNSTIYDPACRIVGGVLLNAYEQAGRGFGFTYPARVSMLGMQLPMFPLVRIDHIYTSPELNVLRAKTLERSGGGDHFPVIAELSIPVMQKP